MESNTYKNSNCSICGKNQKKDPFLSIFDYCPTCDKIICEKCKRKHDQSHYLIKNNEKFVKCLIHPKEYNDSYCNECQTHACKTCRKKLHQGHNKELFDEIEPTEEEKIDINNKINSLKKEKDLLEDNKINKLKKMENELKETQNKIIIQYEKDKINSEKKLKKKYRYNEI